jgi:hypothetical protein
MGSHEKSANISSDILANLGPLTALAGTWEGDQGVDIAPSAQGAVQTLFRERMSFEPMGPVVNGPQVLYGLRYATTAWPLDGEDPFHEEVGYWLWDPANRQVLRSFVVPRGVVVNAGGTADAAAASFELKARVGSQTYGILSNLFLDQAAKTVVYDLKVVINDDGSFSYEEDTQLETSYLQGLFHHTDKNTLFKV